jgi:hypothetical protein
LERLTSNALIPSLSRLKIEEDLSRLLKKDDQRIGNPKVSRTKMTQALDGTNRSDYEEIVIGWQQKLFNRVYMRTISFFFPLLNFI